MERRAKERLIGASILVALIVSIVPELLSGPTPAPPAAIPQQLPVVASGAEPIRNVTVDLATSKAAAIPDAEPASAPAPMAPPSPTPAAEAVQQLPPQPVDAGGMPTAPAPASIESPAAAPISSHITGQREGSHTVGWTVQLGSFASRANADKLMHQLKSQGFAVYVLSGGTGTAIRHRVRVGPLADRDTAERTAARLKGLGHPSSLISPGV